MRGENPHPHQEGNGSRTTSYAVHVVHTPPREALVSLFSCPDKISQQSHELVVGKQGKKEYPHLDKKTDQPERRLTNGNE